jgi:hypothetical protein
LRRWVSDEKELAKPVVELSTAEMKEGADVTLSLPERFEGYKPGYRFL